MGQPPPPPDGDSCPTCGAPVERGQLVCLTCGGRVGLQYRRPPRWQIPVVMAAVVVLLAAVGIFVALQTASGDAEDEVASGPASRQEAEEPEKPARTETTTAASTPSTTETNPKPEQPATNAALATAKRGPVAVLSGVPEPGAAKKYARRLKRQGYTLGKVTNAPGGVGNFSVQYARGSEDAARALAKKERIREVVRVDPLVAERGRGAKLFVVLGARK